jgi:hypothetical protein
MIDFESNEERGANFGLPGEGSKHSTPQREFAINFRPRSAPFSARSTRTTLRRSVNRDPVPAESTLRNLPCKQIDSSNSFDFAVSFEKTAFGQAFSKVECRQLADSVDGRYISLFPNGRYDRQWTVYRRAPVWNLRPEET